MAKATGLSKTIIAGDLHLLKKPGMWQGRSEISGDDVFALEQIEALRKEHNADLFLLGDVLDAVTNLPRPIVAVQTILGEAASGNRVFFIQGQHELVVQAHYENHPWLSLVPGANHIGGKSFKFHGLKAYGMDYFPQAFEALAFSKVPADTQVLFLHGTIDSVMPMAFHFTADSLKKLTDLRFVFAGDYHQAIEVSGVGAKMFYTGSTWQLSTGEPREKSVILFTHSGKEATIERIPLKTRKILKLSELCDENGTFAVQMLDANPIDTTLPKELQMPVILVDMPTAPEMYEELAKHAHIYTTSAANPDTPTRELVDKAGTLSNEEILQSYADKDKSPGQFAFTLDVIENPVDQSIKRLKDKFGMKDVDRTVQAAPTEINLESDNPEEEEEVLA